MRPFRELQQDPNRPESTDPDDYAFVGAADLHPGREWVEVRHDLLAKFGVETGSSDRHATTNVPFYDTDSGRWMARCHFCGSTREGGLKSNIFYFCFFLHKPSKVAVVVGQDCARKYDLGTRSEREFQSRRDEYFRQEEERERLATAKSFLKSYHEWHERGGKFFDFLASLWDQLQERGTLSNKQLDALNRWIYRPDGTLKEQEWTKRPSGELLVDADRHKAEVTHTDEEPTEAQMAYISKLVDELELPYEEISAIYPKNRAEASDAINKLKARVLRQRYHDERQEENERPATSRQLSYINTLMDERSMPSEKRKDARQMLDNGLSSAQASRWISKLKELPYLEDKAR